MTLVALLLFLTLAAGGALPQASEMPATQAAEVTPTGSRESLVRFWLLIGLPGLGAGTAMVVVVAFFASRARRRKLERGELPEVKLE